MKDLGLRVSAIIFLIVGFAHLARVLLRYYVFIGVFMIPYWISIAASIGTLLLSCWLFSLSRKK